VRNCLSLAIVWAVATLGPSPVWAQDVAAETGGTRQITQVRDDLYLVRDGQQCTVFLVTSDGIILGDPLSRATALWLRDELRGRFPQDVRFVLHTYHHYARAEGSSVFNDTAEIVAHAAFYAELAKARRELPERYRFAFRRTLSYSQERLVTLGGLTVRLLNVPASRTPEMTVLYFPREGVVFAVDPPGIGSVPFSFGTVKPGDMFAWIETLVPLKFDSLLLGDGRIVSRAEFDELSTYLSALRAAVTRGARKGQTLSEIQSTATLDEFRTNPHYAKRASQLSDLYATVETKAFSVSAGAATSYVQLSSAFCASHDRCAGGGAVPAMTLTVSTVVHKGLGVTGELTLSGQAWSARTSLDVDEEAATRQSRVAALLRYGPGRSRYSYAVVGGPSITIDDVRGLNQVKGALLPTGGSHPIHQRNVRVGVTVGGDLECLLRRSVTIRLPVRITKVLSEGAGTYFDSTLDLLAGIDVTFRLFNRVSFR
jgi:glyoxylase-like metal-dependent hydrolase (beta-lactamase superfamily II)